MLPSWSRVGFETRTMGVVRFVQSLRLTSARNDLDENHQNHPKPLGHIYIYYIHAYGLRLPCVVKGTNNPGKANWWTPVMF